MTDRNEIDCPRAKTRMTPCIARDGSAALADSKVCVGCGARPRDLLKDLADRYPPAASSLHVRSPGTLADRLTDHVAAYVESKS